MVLLTILRHQEQLEIFGRFDVKEPRHKAIVQYMMHVI